jgi:DNA replication protein DnaC
MIDMIFSIILMANDCQRNGQFNVKYAPFFNPILYDISCLSWSDPIPLLREGFRSFYIRSPRFSYQMSLARGDGSYGNIINKLSRAHVLVIDDLGLAPLTDMERRDLLEVIEERHGHASTIVVSQLPMDHWHEQIGDPTIADAILDRLIHNAHKINLKGGTLRKKYANLT